MGAIGCTVSRHLLSCKNSDFSQEAQGGGEGGGGLLVDMACYHLLCSSIAVYLPLICALILVNS